MTYASLDRPAYQARRIEEIDLNSLSSGIVVAVATPFEVLASIE
jgi:hypothetical protein